MLQRAELEQDAAKRPHVRRIVVGFRLTHLRRHVVRSTLNCKGLVRRAFKNLGNTEVAQFESVVLRQKYVLRLQVAMQNLASMDILKC